MMMYRERQSGVCSYFPGNNVATAGCDNAITMNAAGKTRSDEYFTEYLNTFCRVVLSLWPSIFENAGNSSVAIGWTKKDTITEKLMARLQLAIVWCYGLGG